MILKDRRPGHGGEEARVSIAPVTTQEVKFTTPAQKVRADEIYDVNTTIKKGISRYGVTKPALEGDLKDQFDTALTRYEEITGISRIAKIEAEALFQQSSEIGRRGGLPAISESIELRRQAELKIPGEKSTLSDYVLRGKERSQGKTKTEAQKEKAPKPWEYAVVVDNETAETIPALEQLGKLYEERQKITDRLDVAMIRVMQRAEDWRAKQWVDWSVRTIPAQSRHKEGTENIIRRHFFKSQDIDGSFTFFEVNWDATDTWPVGGDSRLMITELATDPAGEDFDIDGSTYSTVTLHYAATSIQRLANHGEHVSEYDLRNIRTGATRENAAPLGISYQYGKERAPLNLETGARAYEHQDGYGWTENGKGHWILNGSSNDNKLYRHEALPTGGVHILPVEPRSAYKENPFVAADRAMRLLTASEYIGEKTQPITKERMEAHRGGKNVVK